MKHERGVTIMLVIAFMGIFTMILGSITSYTFTQAKYGRALYARERALQIAEAGIEYYRWFLVHTPSVMQNGTNFESPVSYEVEDPEAGRLGEADVSAVINTSCGIPQYIDITSEGRSDSDTRFARTLLAR